MNARSSQSVVLLLCAFVLAHVVHALHPLVHALDAVQAEAQACVLENGDCEFASASGADATLETDHAAEHGDDCALCASSPPVAPHEQASTVSPTWIERVVALDRCETQVRGPPAAFRSRAPPALI